MRRSLRKLGREGGFCYVTPPSVFTALLLLPLEQGLSHYPDLLFNNLSKCMFQLTGVQGYY